MEKNPMERIPMSEEIVSFTAKKKTLYRFCKMIEVIERDTVLDFMEDSIRTLRVCPAHVSMIDVKIDTDELIDYQVERYNNEVKVEDNFVKTLEIGVDVKDIKSFLQSFKMKHEITFKIIEENTETMEEPERKIELKGKKDKITLEKEMETLDTAQFNDPNLPNFSTDLMAFFKLSNSDLREYIKDSKRLDKSHARFVYRDNKLIINSPGDKTKARFVDEPQVTKDTTDNNRIKSSIPIDYLYSISKAIHKNGNTWDIELRSGYPIVMKVELDTGIDCKYIVAPKIEGE